MDVRAIANQPMKYSCSKLIHPASALAWLVFTCGFCHAASAPPNDDLADAQIIPPGTSFAVAGTDLNATQEKFEKAVGYPFVTVHTVWYSWKPSVAGALQITIVRPDGLTAEIGIFKGDAPDAATYLGAYASDIDAGQEYVIAVGNNTAPGAFTLEGSVISASTPPVATAPTISVTAAMPLAIRSTGQNGDFLLEMSAAADSDITVNYSVNGTAVGGTDYKMLKGMTTIPTGSTKAKVKVKPHPATGDTGKVKVKMKLLPGTGYTVGTPSNATVKILSD